MFQVLEIRKGPERTIKMRTLFNLVFAILNFFRLRVRFPSGLETLAFGNDFAQSLVLLANHSFSVDENFSCWIGCVCLILFVYINILTLSCLKL